MLTPRYMASNKNIPAIFKKIVEGAPPEKFNTEHLKAIGFGASNDRALIPLLKDLGFLTGDGNPTERYRNYRDSSRSRSVLGEALRVAYEDLFIINNDKLSKADRDAIVGRFKSVHSATDDLAQRMAGTFLTLLEMADVSQKDAPKKPPETPGRNDDRESARLPNNTSNGELQLAYNIQIQLPATKDIEIYNAIFKSIKENLMR